MENTQNTATMSQGDHVANLEKEIEYLIDCQDALNKAYSTVAWIINLHQERIKELTETEE